MTKKRKRFLFFIIFCPCLNLLLSVLVVLPFILNYANVLYESKRVREVFSNWCYKSNYIYYDGNNLIVDNKICYDLTWLRSSISKAENVDYSYTYAYKNFLILDDNIFFLGYITNKKETRNEYSLFKTDLGLKSAEKVISIYQSDHWLSKEEFYYAFGFDQRGFFRFESHYFSYDFLNGELNEMDSNDEKTKLCVFDNYLESLEIEVSDCDYQEDTCTFSYLNNDFCFCENSIKKECLDKLRKYKYRPAWCLSFPNGTTSILYYTKGHIFVDASSCALISYNRDTNEVIYCQCFDDVSKSVDESMIFPKVSL